MVILRKILLCFFLLLSYFVSAQDLKQEMEYIVESLMENAEEEQDYTTLIQDLYALHENPIDINKATAEDLEQLPMLSEVQIVNLLNYREEVEHIYTLFELQSIYGFTPELLRDLQYFIRCGEQKEIKRLPFRKMLEYSSNSILLRGQRIIEKQAGYKDLAQENFKDSKTYEKWQNRRYLGNPWRYYFRYETRYKNKFKVGLVAEKDPGEEFFTGTQKRGFDHYTGFVQVNDIGILKTAIVGDYIPRFGQGLATWGGYSMGKSGYFLNVHKRNEGLKKYASTNENDFMQGVGVTIEPLSRLLLTAYYSNKKIDGSVRQIESDDEEEHFTSFLNSGYHRSHNELAKRKNIGEEIIGANINYMYKNLKVGANFIDYQFSKPFQKGTSLSDLYDFSGNHGQNYSLYTNYRYDRLYFFGEAAIDKQKAKGFLGGVAFSANERLNFSMLYRDYNKDYQALYASGFGDKSHTNNERGWYLGMEMLPWAKWKLNAYFDMYEFPWLRSGANAPARGYDYKIRLQYTHSRNLNGYLQFYQEENEVNTGNSDVAMRFLVKEKRSKLRLHLDYEVAPNVRFKDRIALSFYKKEQESYKGFLVFHDIVYRNPLFPVSFATRYALFDVEDYDARIYAYENDVLYAFSVPALQNKGFRFYFNAKWDINEHFTLWAKYSVTKYRNKEEIRSGLDLVTGNRIQEVKLQLRYKF